MQTFLPYPNFIGSARVLDVRRLGKQRVENLQIMQVLLGHRLTNTSHLEPTGAFRLAYFDESDMEVDPDDVVYAEAWHVRSVPITRVVTNPQSEWRVVPLKSKAWSKHPAVAMWRGYEHCLMQYQNSICTEWTDRGFKDTCRVKTEFLYNAIQPETLDGYPDWMGEDDFHISHQSNLLAKHPVYYSQFFHNVPNDLPYVWPVNESSR